jgi:hypothetical protein
LKQGVLRTSQRDGGGAMVHYHDPVGFSNNNAFVKQQETREDYIKCVNAMFKYKEASPEGDDLVSIALSPRDWSVIKYIIMLAGTLTGYDYNKDGPLAAADWLWEKLNDADIPSISYTLHEKKILISDTWPEEALALKE